MYIFAHSLLKQMQISLRGSTYAPTCHENIRELKFRAKEKNTIILRQVDWNDLCYYSFKKKYIPYSVRNIYFDGLGIYVIYISNFAYGQAKNAITILLTLLSTHLLCWHFGPRAIFVTVTSECTVWPQYYRYKSISECTSYRNTITRMQLLCIQFLTYDEIAWFSFDLRHNKLTLFI